MEATNKVVKQDGVFINHAQTQDNPLQMRMKMRNVVFVQSFMMGSKLSDEMETRWKEMLRMFLTEWTVFVP